jgi:hypothetical protein
VKLPSESDNTYAFPLASEVPVCVELSSDAELVPGDPVLAANRYTCAPMIGVEPVATEPVKVASDNPGKFWIVAVVPACPVNPPVFCTVSDTV